MTAQSLTARAVNLLARREHSQEELRKKLRKAEFEIDEINVAIQKLAKIDLQSDLRFAENYLHYRSQRGFGSQKIKFELNERGVDKQTINAVFEQEDIDWFFLAVLARNKRFGQKAPDDLKDRAKQQRFLPVSYTHLRAHET